MYLKFYKGGRIENNRTAVCGSIYQFAEAMRMQIAFTLYRNHIFYSLCYVKSDTISSIIENMIDDFSGSVHLFSIPSYINTTLRSICYSIFCEAKQ